MKKDQEKARTPAEIVLGELDDMEMQILALVQLFKKTQNLITESGDPEQNLQKHARLLRDMYSSVLDYIDDEYWDPTYKLNDLFTEVARYNLGILKNRNKVKDRYGDDIGFRKLVTSDKVDGNSEK